MRWSQVDQFQSQLAAKDLQIVAFHRKMQEAKEFSPQVKEMLTPIRQMMEKKQAEVGGPHAAGVLNGSHR